MNEIELLKTRVAELENFVSLLKNSSTIPLEIDQSFKDRFATGLLKFTGTGVATTQNINLSGDPQLITVPAQPTGTVGILVGGAAYNILYK